MDAEFIAGARAIDSVDGGEVDNLRDAVLADEPGWIRRGPDAHGRKENAVLQGDRALRRLPIGQ
jgi:hypothetical protein